MTDKLTPKSMEDQYKHQLETFKRKNHDYGNSFEKSLDTFGLVAGIVRMNDKFERLLSLTQGNKNALVGSESLVDTLEDLSNYAAMAACYLKGKKVEDWKAARLREIDHAVDATKIKAGSYNSNKFTGIRIFDDPVKADIKIENIAHPKQFILDVTKDIVATVRMKEKKNEFLVYTDISYDAGRIATCAIYNDISQLDVMEIVNDKCVQNKLPLELIGFIEGVILRHIYYMKKSRGLANALDNQKIDASKINTGNVDIGSKNVVVRNLVPKSIEDIQKDKVSERIDAILEDIRKECGGVICKKIVPSRPFIHKPNADIKLDLEPYLEEMRKRREKEVGEKTVSELMAEHAAAQKKAMEDLDMMLDAMANGQLVSRVVDNGDGSFVAYWEKAGEEDESGEE